MDNQGMGVSGEYIVTAFGLSLVALVLAVVHAFRTVKAYRVYHDERAAVTLAKGIALVVISFGLTVSSSGLLMDSAALSVAGLSVSRGALIVLMATLVLADVRPDPK